MKTIKILFMIMFACLSGWFALLSLKDLFTWGMLGAIPYAMTALFFLLISSSINKNLRKS